MPAWRLDSEDRSVSAYDVGISENSESGMLVHAVLCLATKVKSVNWQKNRVDAVHMGPPFGRAPMSIHALGTAELDGGGLDRGERRRIKSFVDERLWERDAQSARLNRLARVDGIEDALAQEYVIFPDHTPADAGTSLWRFSCVGFVLCAYEAARIQLLDRDSLPNITLEKIRAAYPGFAKRLAKQDFRERFGIGRGTEWPVALAGYLLNSLAREAAEIRNAPYVVEAGDEHFP